MNFQTRIKANINKVSNINVKRPFDSLISIIKKEGVEKNNEKAN